MSINDSDSITLKSSGTGRTEVASEEEAEFLRLCPTAVEIVRSGNGSNLSLPSLQKPRCRTFWPFYKTDQKLNANLEEMWPALHEFKEGQRARSIERRKKPDRKAFIMTNMAREALEKGVPVRQDAIRCIRLDPDVLPLFHPQLLEISKTHWASFVKQANWCCVGIEPMNLKEDMKFR
ncbi:uncharacterized protein LMH87_009144 [Akanthomyces muscarius]|uniref:Uncharacterized protein n=1 Tax=Akanthomyces muscarius TaxID=2231603 RepID=A0A9W8QKM4_AKAMU|nr:uncharacterized protein LMH87_009144 [Akanthomyces muscarius]KAJ4158627.1 hypothetical protein LMH87_009144 [Akanthomyces muscarius]